MAKEVKINGTKVEVTRPIARDAMIQILKLWSEPKWERGIEKQPKAFGIRESEAILHAL